MPSLRGAERRGNLVLSISYELRDCFTRKDGFKDLLLTAQLDEVEKRCHSRLSGIVVFFNMQKRLIPDKPE
jgi:hypothetical protein